MLSFIQLNPKRSSIIEKFRKTMKFEILLNEIYYPPQGLLMDILEKDKYTKIWIDSWN